MGWYKVKPDVLVARKVGEMLCIAQEKTLKEGSSLPSCSSGLLHSLRNDWYEPMLVLVVPLKSKDTSNSFYAREKTLPLCLISASLFPVSQLCPRQAAVGQSSWWLITSSPHLARRPVLAAEQINKRHITSRQMRWQASAIQTMKSCFLLSLELLSVLDQFLHSI